LKVAHQGASRGSAQPRPPSLWYGATCKYCLQVASSAADVPPYVSPVTEDEKRRLEAFEDEVIDRLFVLNAERAA